MYLKELVRYIHLNPLRAKIVADMGRLTRYQYCGHGVLMGKTQCPWQDTGYVLAYFGRKISEARKHYCCYVSAGLDQGRRPELVGGGLIRSLGGWKEAVKLRLRAQGRLKGDERILGQSDFVLRVLEEADEHLDRYYEAKRLGYTLQSVEQKVCEIFGVEPEHMYSKSHEKIRADARGLLCAVYAFVRFLVEHKVVDYELMERKIKLKLPDRLPRAMDPEDLSIGKGVLPHFNPLPFINTD